MERPRLSFKPIVTRAPWPGGVGTGVRERAGSRWPAVGTAAAEPAGIRVRRHTGVRGMHGFMQDTRSPDNSGMVSVRADIKSMIPCHGGIRRNGPRCNWCWCCYRRKKSDHCSYPYGWHSTARRSLQRWPPCPPRQTYGAMAASVFGANGLAARAARGVFPTQLLALKTA